MLNKLLTQRTPPLKPIPKPRDILRAGQRDGLGARVIVIRPVVPRAGGGVDPLQGKGKAEVGDQGGGVLFEMLDADVQRGAGLAVAAAQVGRGGVGPEGGDGLGGGHEALEIKRAGQGHRRVVEGLRAQPVVIADRPVPRVAHEGEGEQIVQNLGRDQPLDIGAGGMFPQPPARRALRHPAAPPQRLGRIAQQDVILHRARFQRQRQRRAPRLGDMDEQVSPPGAEDHAARLAVFPAFAIA